MGLARVGAVAGAGLVAALSAARLASARDVASVERDGAILVAADRDDDDGNGHVDGEEDLLAPSARVDLVRLDRALVGAEIRPAAGGDRVRLVVGGRPFPWGKALPPDAWVQGLAAGPVQLVATRGATRTPLAFEVVGAQFRDGAGALVDPSRAHASLERTPPSRVEGAADARYDDPDALRVVVEMPEAALARTPLEATVQSLAATGAEIDALVVPLEPIACPSPHEGTRCAASAPIRLVVDEVDQKHPLVVARSVRAEVGGALVVRQARVKLGAIRVAGPRSSPEGAIDRLRATLRLFVLRLAPGTGAAIGGTDAAALAILRAEVALASAVWGQCGVSFGPTATLDAKIVDPPPPHLVAIGDDLGLPATGGSALRVRAAGKLLEVPIAHGATPERVADELAQAAEAAGLRAVVSANARIAPAALGSVDVSIRRSDGRLVAVEPATPGAPLTNDRTMVARIGAVDLTDGLQHFGDMDSVAGTLEERALLKALDDGDPRTIEVVVIPFFGGGGRIGESFIGSDGSSIRNAVLLDRAGIRARRSSLTLAHELGHVLMDMPGHPDDYGLDTPTLLMDSDGSDASPFGPRRLTLDECARTVRQSGPAARVPLLTAWPLAPLPIPRVSGR